MKLGQVSPWRLKAPSRSICRLHISLHLPPCVSHQFSIVTTPLIGLNSFKVQMARVRAWTGQLSLLQVGDIIQSAVQPSPAVLVCPILHTWFKMRRGVYRCTISGARLLTSCCTAARHFHFRANKTANRRGKEWNIESQNEVKSALFWLFKPGTVRTTRKTRSLSDIKSRVRRGTSLI